MKRIREADLNWLQVDFILLYGAWLQVEANALFLAIISPFLQQMLQVTSLAKGFGFGVLFLVCNPMIHKSTLPH